MTIYIRTAGIKDLESIKALLLEAFHATYDPIYGAQKAEQLHLKWHGLERLKQMLEAPHSEFLLGDNGTEISGVAFAALDPTNPDLVSLQHVYVLPAAQGRGIGVMLLDEIAQSFYDAKRIRTEVAAGNSSALGFYHHLGFVEISRQTDQDMVDGQVVTLERPML